MRISQLSQAADLPVGTVKFYLRTGLLHPGRATSATQAIYDQSHLDRLRLVRALLEVGKLSHAEIQRILAALEAPQAAPDAAALDTVELLSLASAGSNIEGDQVDLTGARAAVAQLGWTISDDSPHLPALALALSALQGLGVQPSADRLRVYAEAASHVARNDVATVTEADPEVRALVAAAGTALYDALLTALRRLALENQIARQRTRVPGQRATTIPSA